jgi:hypothetical protein
MEENFDTSRAYIFDNLKNEPGRCWYEIDEYLNNKYLSSEVKEKKYKMICINGHELIACNSKEKKNYFRHKNTNDVSPSPMTIWHSKWQKLFKITEKIFPAKKRGGIKNRKADAVVHNYVLEFQHSRIDSIEVENRKKDYKLFNKEILWIIECGDDTIEVRNLNVSKCFMIIFRKNIWKYKNFKCHNYIYLDHNGKIYRVNPNKIKSNMIDVIEFKLKKDFVKLIKENKNYWNNKSLPQCILYHNQRGAGCGKTYESIQLLNGEKSCNVCKDKLIKCNECKETNEIFQQFAERKNTFIYLTKMHSAKDIAYFEFKEQTQNGKLNNLKVDTQWNGEIATKISNKWKMTYTHKINKKQCNIIMGTIDSFMLALGNKNHGEGNQFIGLVNSIKSRSQNLRISESGNTSYGGNTKLSKECLIIIDEAQDLPPNYIEAICVIMRETYIDTYVIGDKLQSLWFEDNTHTMLEKEELPNTIIKKSKVINQVRRFHNTKFKDYVNNKINFKEFDLKPISKICDEPKCEHIDKSPIEFQIPKIYFKFDFDDEQIKKINNIIDNEIIVYIEKEIKKNNYLPKDFMFIFPLVTKNPFGEQLEAKLQDFWIEKFKNINYQKYVLKKNNYWKDYINDESYHKFVYFHKSEDGKPINLIESENATRILSIHASKGSGRNVVFVLGINEYRLNIFSHGTKNLIYESLLHVALTRQKKSLYIGIEDNDDDINRRFKNYKRNKKIEPDLKVIKKNNSINDISEYCIDKDKIGFNIIKQKYLSKINYIENKVNKNSEIIDWGHHTIRYWTYFYSLLINIINSRITPGISINYADQFLVIINKISNIQIRLCKYKEYYEILNEIKKRHKNNENSEIFPLLYFDSKENWKYYIYKNTIHDIIKNMQNKFKKNTDFYKLPKLCPLEIIILIHMIKIVDNIYKFNKDLTIMDVYSIIYCYDECNGLTNENHNNFNCICLKEFNKGNKDTIKYKKIRLSIQKHYEIVKIINKTFEYFKKELLIKFNVDFKDIHYNVFHSSDYRAENNDYKIYNNYMIIGYSKKYVFNIIIQPKFNTINYNNVMVKNIFTNFILMKQKKNTKNFDKYNNKKIITCIFTLDDEKPILYDFNIDINDIDIIKNIKNYMFNKYSKLNYKVYDFYLYHKNFKVNTKKNIVEYMCDKLKEENYDYLPCYILNFFDDRRRTIKKTKSKIVLKNLMDKIIFIKNINDELNYSIDNFLGLNIDYENDIYF